MIEENAGSLFFTIPIDKVASCKVFFKLLNQDFPKAPIKAIDETDDCPEISPGSNASSSQSVRISPANNSIEDIRHLIKDCGISHTTLEEVFLKVTKADKAAGEFLGK